jgi:hypothetical protein
LHIAEDVPTAAGGCLHGETGIPTVAGDVLHVETGFLQCGGRLFSGCGKFADACDTTRHLRIRTRRRASGRFCPAENAVPTRIGTINISYK